MNPTTQSMVDGIGGLTSSCINYVLAVLPQLLPILAVFMGVTFALALGWRVIKWIGGG